HPHATKVTGPAARKNVSCGSSRVVSSGLANRSCVGPLGGEDLNGDRADTAGGGRVLAAGSQTGQHLAELVDVGRLCEVVVESDVSAPAARFVVGPTGDRGQEDPGGSRVSAQESGQLEAVQHRHAQIDEANVRRELECLCQSFWAAVGNPRVVAPRPD